MPDVARLIAIEGGDGAGKTTQAVLLADAIGAVATREPGGTKLGERLRDLLLDPSYGEIDARAELMMMLAARAQHVAERIEPLLASGSWVVVDRFAFSTLAYQGYGRGLPLEEVRQACDLATGGRWPDLTIVLDVEPGTAARRKSRDVSDRFEKEDEGFHRRVREGFRSLTASDPAQSVLLDGSASVADVERQVRTVVAERLGR